MTEHERAWAVAVRYRHAYEADLAIARLTSAEILAVRRGGGPVGIFAPGFDARTSGGVEVLVPSDELVAAREVLGLVEGAG